MGIHYVSTRQDSFFVTYVLLTVNELNPSSTAGSDRFQDVECLFIFWQSPIRLKLLVLLTQHIAHWRNREIDWKLYSKPIHIDPKEILATELCWSWKMIGFLILIKILNVRRHYVACPLQVEHIIFLAFNHRKTSCLATVDYCIVYMCVI